MSRHSISRLLCLFSLALLLAGGSGARAQLLPFLSQPTAKPDPVTYGVQVEAGNLAAVKDWLDAGMDPDYVADRIGTGLMIAAWYGNIPMMELLVQRGAQIDRKNALGERAIMHAAWRGQNEAIKWLLARGAKVNSEPMQWSPLHFAVFAGHAESMKLLLERGADINARSTNGSSPIMMAVYEGHDLLVKDLISRGADLSIKNDRGDGALEWAFKYKRLGIARMVANPQQFAAAANRPSQDWGPVVRSQPTPQPGPPPSPAEEMDPEQVRIQQLVGIRNALARRGMTDSVDKLDKRIASLRAQRARSQKVAGNRGTVLEINARRDAPTEQNTRLIFEAGETPP
jgi:hypothetical protein